MAVISQGKRAGGKLPRGPHRLSDEEVAADQRRRLVDAMIKLAGGKGYAATTVANIIARAQVSRKTFYEHFADRKDLLLAAFDTASPAALEKIRLAAQRADGPTRQVEALMRRLTELARESPGTIALSAIEIAAVEPEGVQRRERLMDAFGQLIDKCLGGVDGERKALPPTLALALAGGTYRTLDAQLRLGRGAEPTAVAAQLARWTRSYHPVPSYLMAEQEQVPSPWHRLGGDGLLGGRAPGTLTLAPDGYEAPREVRSKGFVHHANRERILDAVARLTAQHGYTELTAVGIAERADISERAFLAHFKNKDDAFVAAVEVGHVKAQALVERARSGAPNWRTGVRNSVGALLEFLASEPYFTRLAFVDAPLAGPKMAKRMHEQAGAYARLMLDGAPQRRRPPAIAPEATVQSIFELAFYQATKDQVPKLSSLSREITYLALAPYLGVTDAAELAAS
ncbi:MAG: TetR/AcrR family transcriptional regulator [Solirubrobacteraceae bacterium]